MALTALSTGISAFSQNQQGKAAEGTANYNAMLQRRQADQQRDVRKENVKRQRDDKGRQMSSVDVHQAASGVLADTGSPTLVRADIESRLSERINGYAENAIAQENYTRSQADRTEFAGQQARAASKIAMGGTILGGLGKMASQYGSGVKSGSIKYNPLGLYKPYDG